MESVVLSPTADDLVIVEASFVPGIPVMHIEGVPDGRCLADRVRAGLINVGFGLPRGGLTVTVSHRLRRRLDEYPASVDLAVAMSMLLADPAHSCFRRSGLIASGSMRLDGSLTSSQAALLHELPTSPWVGRIWRPEDRIPDPNEDAILSIVDVADLKKAWGAVLWSIGLEQEIEGRRDRGSHTSALSERPTHRIG